MHMSAKRTTFTIPIITWITTTGRLQSTHRSLPPLNFWCLASNRQFHLRAFSIPFNSFVSDTGGYMSSRLRGSVFQFIRFWYKDLSGFFGSKHRFSFNSFVSDTRRLWVASCEELELLFQFIRFWYLLSLLALLGATNNFQFIRFWYPWVNQTMKSWASGSFNSFVSDTLWIVSLFHHQWLLLSIHSFLILEWISNYTRSSSGPFNSFVSDTKETRATPYPRFFLLSIHSFLIRVAVTISKWTLPSFQFIRFWYALRSLFRSGPYQAFNSFVSDTRCGHYFEVDLTKLSIHSFLIHKEADKRESEAIVHLSIHSFLIRVQDGFGHAAHSLLFQFIRFWYEISSSEKGLETCTLSIHSFLIHISGVSGGGRDREKRKVCLSIHSFLILFLWGLFCIGFIYLFLCGVKVFLCKCFPTSTLILFWFSRCAW